MGGTGQKLTDVIYRAWVSPFTTKSDFARTKASQVAAASSAGFITTHLFNNHYSNLWVVTREGLEYLHEHYN